MPTEKIHQKSLDQGKDYLNLSPSALATPEPTVTTPSSSHPPVRVPSQEIRLGGFKRLLKAYLLLFQIGHLRRRHNKLSLKLDDLRLEVDVLHSLRVQLMAELDDLLVTKDESLTKVDVDRYPAN